MKENGIMTRDTAEVMRDIQMEISIKVNSSLVKLMVKAVINGFKAVKYMMENGLKVCVMGMEYGKGCS
jgi:hypothetical protein